MRGARVLLQLWLAAHWCAAHPGFRYEQLHNYGLGKRVIPEYWRVSAPHGYARPQPLRFTTPPYWRPPYRNVYQGVRRSTDQRVYVKKFNYAAKPMPHSVFCQAIVACTISHVALEAQSGDGALLRGGAGHRHLAARVRAGAGSALRATLSVYCRRPEP